MGERIECHCCDSEETVEDWKRKRVREEKKNMKKGITARKLAYASMCVRISASLKPISLFSNGLRT